MPPSPGAVSRSGFVRTTGQCADRCFAPSSGLVEDLYSGRSGADFHDLLHQGVRHTVEVPIKSNVVARDHWLTSQRSAAGRQRGFFQAVKHFTGLSTFRY